MLKSFFITSLMLMMLSSFAHAAVDISPDKLKKIEEAIESQDKREYVVRELLGSELRGQARADFKRIAKDWSPDYPPVAYVIRLEGLELLMVWEENDGGWEVDLYSLDGQYIVGGSAGESTSMRWSR